VRIERTIAPVANPVGILEIMKGAGGLIRRGRSLEALTCELKKYFGVSHVSALSSGKAAFFLILTALKRLEPKKTRVIIPAYTCFSVPSAILKAGLEVVPVDIDAETFDFVPRLLKEAVDKKTLAVVPNHLFGGAADVELARKAAEACGAYVVEDAAQAMGGACKGRKLGTIGDAGFFSLGRGKNITCGGGGIIITDSNEIGGELDSLYSGLEGAGFSDSVKDILKVVAMDIFLMPWLYWLPLSIPSLRLGETIFHHDFPVEKLSSCRAGMMYGWEDRLERAARVRREATRVYTEGLGMRRGSGVETPCLRFPLLFDDEWARGEFYSRTKKLGVSLMYPCPINEIPEIRESFRGQSYPGALKVAKTLVMLPTHGLVGNEVMDEIIGIYREIITAKRPAGNVANTEGVNEAYNYN